MSDESSPDGPIPDETSSDGRLPDGRFAKGNPGGPGRPRAIERITAFDQRAAEAAPEAIDALVAAAKAGNLKAIEMLLNRVWPMRRGHPVRIDAPEIRGTADVLPASAALTSAVFAGEVTPEEGAAAASVLKTHHDAIEILDFERRLTDLEEKRKAAERASGSQRSR
jgi:hypothetical protein